MWVSNRHHGASGVLQGLSLLLGKHPDAEVSVEVRFEGGRDDQVLPWRQLEAGADLPLVGESLGLGGLGVGQEEVLVQVDLPLSVELGGAGGTANEHRL